MWFSFDTGIVRRNIFLHILVNLELGWGNKTYLVLLCIVFGELLKWALTRQYPSLPKEASLYTTGQSHSDLLLTSHWLQRESRQLPKWDKYFLAKKSWVEEGRWTIKNSVWLGFFAFSSYSALKLLIRLPLWLAAFVRLMACWEVPGCKGKSHS